MDTAKPRYYALDALRGLSILLMILHHFAIDLTMFGYVPDWLLDNPIVETLQPIFASCFIALSGASSRFSRSSLKRGLKILVCAAVVSGATALASHWMNQRLTVLFGILHFLGVASILYHFLQPLIDRLKVPGPLWLLLFLIARLYFPMVGNTKWLLPFGFMYPGLYSADYYPILPWIFMYFFGVWIADLVKAGRFSDSFYSFRCRPLEAVSRHSLWIYLLHQPIIMAGFQLFFLISK